MPPVMQQKRTATPGAAPTTAQLAPGELAVNTYDGVVFMERDTGTPEIVVVGRPITISASAPSGGRDGDIWIQYTP